VSRGSNTSAEKINEFRAEYIRLGSARAAARSVGIPESTGVDMARAANGDPDFVRVRSEIAREALNEVESLMMDALRIVQARVMVEDPSPERIAQIAVENDLKSFNYNNPKPAYLAQLVAGYKALTAHRKIEADRALAATQPSASGQEIRIVISGPDGTTVSG
jgi:hypothetical protein